MSHRGAIAEVTVCLCLIKPSTAPNYTQAGIKPPTFVLFCNDAKLFPDDYRKYIERQFRCAALNNAYGPSRVGAQQPVVRQLHGASGLTWAVALCCIWCVHAFASPAAIHYIAG